MSEQAGGKAGKDSGKAKAKAVSRSARAGLQVSLSCVVRLTRSRTIYFYRYYYLTIRIYTIIFIDFKGKQVKVSMVGAKSGRF